VVATSTMIVGTRLPVRVNGLATPRIIAGTRPHSLMNTAVDRMRAGADQEVRCSALWWMEWKRQRNGIFMRQAVAPVEPDLTDH